MPDRYRTPHVVWRSAALLLSVVMAAGCSRDAQINRSATSTSPNSAATTSTTRLTKTEVAHVRPVDDQGKLAQGFTVTDTVDGAWCQEPSGKVGGPAHSCNAGDVAYDPCWTEEMGPSGPSVLCMRQPWSKEVHRLLTKTKVGPEPAAPGDTDPWGIELADGQRCRFAIGAHDSLSRADEDVVDYYCDEQALGLELLRGLNKTQPVWTARAARYVNGHHERVAPQQIATAWFSP